MIYNPFEQFEIVKIIGLFGISITNSSIIIMISLVLVLSMFRLVTINNGLVIPSRYQMIVEKMYMLVVGIVNDSIGKKGEKLVGIIWTLFVSLMVLNIVGMVPYSYTVTSQLVITMVLSVSVWVGKLIIGLKKHGVKLFGMFIPDGLPFVMVPFFVIIEIIGFIIPMISLSVRLFANMLSGHVLLKVLFGFTWIMWLKGGLVTIVSVLPLSVLMLLLGLETAVAIIQAFVFTLLTSIYIGDMVSGGH